MPGPTPPLGRVVVEVPHWAATVTIYDRELRPVSALTTVRESVQEPGVYEAAADVSPGIYQVEVTLVGQSRVETVPDRGRQSQRLLVGVFIGEIARVPRDTWRLEFSSVAPLAGIAASPQGHRAAAEELSRRPTWTRRTGGDSRLFLFVRTMNPTRFPRFSDGLHLLDADHRLVTDFRDGVRTSPDGGWLAFTGDLPAGYYILRRGRSGVPVRYQPISLHAGWETQVFMAARSFPSLRLMTMGMAPFGTGFRADDETMMAVETILASLLNPSGDTPVTTNEKLTFLLRNGHDNPWLDVLAAYSLLGWRERRTSHSTWDENGPMAALLRSLLASLDRIDSHPDARAVRIGSAADEAPAPFWQPPLLRAGLMRVQRDSTRHVDTIPLDSLTDCVLDNQVTNGPWTSWRAFDRRPRSEHPTPAATTAQMIDIRPPAEQPAAEGLARTGADSLLAASIVQTVQTMIDAAGPTALPERIEVNTGLVLDELLAQVRPEAFSVASGMPLPRSEEGLQQLRRRVAEQDPAAGHGQEGPLRSDEQEILSYALTKTALRKTALRKTGAAAVTESVSDTPTPGTAPPVPVDAVVAVLRTESERLGERAGNATWRADGGSPDTARELARRIRKVGDTLLGSAEFIAVTGPDGRLIDSNGAFAELLSQSVPQSIDGQAGGQHQIDALEHGRQAWARAFAGAAPGHSTVNSPVTTRIASEWELWRKVIVDATGGEPQGHLNVMRGKGAAGPGAGALERVQPSLSALRQYASLFAYGSREHRDEYTRHLRELTSDLETATSGG